MSTTTTKLSADDQDFVSQLIKILATRHTDTSAADLVSYAIEIAIERTAQLQALAATPIQPCPSDMILISRSEYHSLVNDSGWLTWLNVAGVKDWEGFNRALKLCDGANIEDDGADT